MAAHPHVDTPRPRGTIRVDCHCHTMWSGDCTTTVDELVAALSERPVDVVCITDHGTVNGARELAGSLPCDVIVGQEVRTGAGEIIGWFLEERIPNGLGHVDAARRIRAQGGLVYVPHPFDPMRANLAEAALDELVALGLVDALEVLNAKTSLSSLNARAAAYATDHALVHGAGSDAHVPGAFGAAYVEMPACDLTDPAAFLASMASGRVVGHHWDQPRAWTPRIVPSTQAL